MAELSAQGAVIKLAYEGEDDTNAFTDARRDKLDGVATGANRVATGNVTPYSGDLDFSAGLGGLSDGDKGDITVTAGVWTIDDGVVTLAKLTPAVQTSLGRADSAVQPGDIDPTYTALAASRDTAAADDGADIECTAAATLTVIAGTITRGCTITQMGAGAATIAAGAGVTINKEADVQAVTNGENAVAFLKPTSTADTFILTGSLAAV